MGRGGGWRGEPGRGGAGEAGKAAAGAAGLNSVSRHDVTRRQEPAQQGHSGPEHGTAHAGGAGVRPRGRQAGRGVGAQLLEPASPGRGCPCRSARPRRGRIRIPRVKGGVHTLRRVKRFFSF